MHKCLSLIFCRSIHSSAQLLFQFSEGQSLFESQRGGYITQITTPLAGLKQALRPSMVSESMGALKRLSERG